MAKTLFQVEILTPEGKVFDDEVEMVSTRTSVGSIGVLANHTPLLAMLDACELRLHKGDGEILRFAQGEGYMQIGDNKAMILIEDAIPAADLDADDLEARIAERKSELEAMDADTEGARSAERDITRLEAFLSVAASN
ncbi:MAG: ATP synthase F1 subunit epsilon [Solirubrobacterales bacterium]|nr:ATP synthase F1 subunit epsilon [Solirubrobacterales bacterium]